MFHVFVNKLILSDIIPHMYSNLCSTELKSFIYLTTKLYQVGIHKQKETKNYFLIVIWFPNC